VGNCNPETARLIVSAPELLDLVRRFKTGPAPAYQELEGLLAKIYGVQSENTVPATPLSDSEEPPPFWLFYSEHASDPIMLNTIQEAISYAEEYAADNHSEDAYVLEPVLKFTASGVTETKFIRTSAS
jgi:hypothetical protein